MEWIEMDDAIRDARATVERADLFVGQMAKIISGRLRTGSIGWNTLDELKRELRNWNMHTGKWKNK